MLMALGLALATFACIPAATDRTGTPIPPAKLRLPSHATPTKAEATTASAAFTSEAAGVDDSETGAEHQDLQTVATQMDITLQEATDRYGWNDDFARAVANIRASYPGDFTSAEITGDAEALVMFMGQTPSGAKAEVDAFTAAMPGITISYREGMGFNEQEIENAVAGAYYAVYGSSSILEASASFDIEARRIDITVQTAGTPPGPALDELRQQAETGATDATRPNLLDVVSVSVVAVSHELGGEDSGSGTSWERKTKGIPEIPRRLPWTARTTDRSDSP